MKYKLTLLLIVPTLFLCACSSPTSKSSNTQIPQSTQINTIDPTTSITITPKPTSKNTIPSSSVVAKTPQPIKTTLTESELSYFTEYLNSPENNGFIQSQYSTICEIDLSETLYGGAGDYDFDLSKDEEALYIERTTNEIDTDITKFTTTQINTLLNEKAGISLGDVRKGFDWFYLEEYDAYYMQHGDTNYSRVQCSSGYKTDSGLYVLKYEHGYFETYTVTMQKKDSNYLFVSNLKND